MRGMKELHFPCRKESELSVPSLPILKLMGSTESIKEVSSSYSLIFNAYLFGIAQKRASLLNLPFSLFLYLLYTSQKRRMEKSWLLMGSSVSPLSSLSSMESFQMGKHSNS